MRSARRPAVWVAVTLLGALVIPDAAGGSSAVVSTTEVWVRTGGPLGGLGYDVRMRPDNPDIMFVTDAWAGVFRSDDAGITWHPANTGITARSGPSGDAIPIFSLTIDPHDPDTIWVGTWNTRGIFKSTDGGMTWDEKVTGITEPEGITFRGFTVDPLASDVVYAAAEISSWVWAGAEMPGREFDRTAGVIYKTLDGGEHWAAVWRGDNLARYVWIDPTDHNIVYASTGIFDREAANSDPDSSAPGGVGVIKSTDGGTTWTLVDQGLDNLYVGSLFLHPENPQVLLAGSGSNQYHDNNGAYLTTDGANTWTRVLREDNISAVEFTADPAVAYAGSEGAIYRSDDGGRTWQMVAGGPEGWGPPGVRAGFPIDMQADPRNPNRIFVNNYGGGNFVSHDGGRTWSAASTGYTGALTRDIAVDPAASGRVYAAARSGLFVSDDGGSGWRGLGFGSASALEFHAVAVDPSDPRHVLAASNWSGVLMASHDGGRSWDLVGPNLGEPRGWRVIEFAAAEPSVVYAGTGGWRSAGQFSDALQAAGVFVSHDGGSNWEEINTQVTTDAQVADLAVHPEFVGFVYAASTTHGLLRTFNGGLEWEAVGGGLPEGAQARSVAFDPNRPEIQLVGFDLRGLYRSDDTGEHWTGIAAGLTPEGTITDIVFDPTRPGQVYASDLHSGVYLSQDAGLTWRPIIDGLRTRAINAMALSSDGSHLYAATEGEGVYRLDLTGVNPEAAEPLWVFAETPPGSETTTTRATAAESPASSTTTVVDATGASAEGSGGGPAGLWVVIGAAVAGMLLGLAALLVRRRRA